MVARRLADDHPEVRAILQDTVVPTVVSGGIRNNVIPSEAWVNLNCRLLPDTGTDAFLEGLKKTIDDPSIDIKTVSRPDPDPPAIMPLDSALYQAIGTASKRLWPGTVVVPYMSTGATDSEYLRRAGIKTYGVGLPLEATDQIRMHGNDERVRLEQLDAGARFFYEIVAEMNR